MLESKKWPLLFLLTAPTTSKAQSYDQLWKSVDAATKADLPKTALERIKVIRTKAERERNEVQLLRTYLLTGYHAESISSDSGRVELQRLENYAEKASTPLMRALWLNATAQRRLAFQFADPEEVRHTRDLFLASIADLSLLSNAKAKDFLPLFEQGKDAHLFNDDLLHALTYSALESNSEVLPDTLCQKEAERIANHYQQLGNRSAELLYRLKALEIEQENADEERLDIYNRLVALSKEFEDVSANVETYIALTELLRSMDVAPLLSEVNDPEEIEKEGVRLRYDVAQRGIALYPNNPRTQELKNAVAQMTRPMLGINTDNTIFLPNRPIQLHATACNNQQGTLRLRQFKDYSRGDIWAKFGYDDLEKREYLPMTIPLAHHNKTITWEKKAPYEEQTQIVTLDGLPIGNYVVELLVNGKVEEVALFSVSNLMVYDLGVESDHRVTVVDATTGMPQPDATLRQYQKVHNRLNVTNYKLDALANCRFDANGNGFSNIFAETATDRSALGISLYAHQSNINARANSGTRLSVFTDRGIYRPGQTVKASAIVYQQEGDVTTVVKEESVRLILRNANHEVVQSDTVKTDVFGVATTNFVLPTKGLWGQWHVEVRRLGDKRTLSSTDIRVEEYKRPTLVATLNKPQTAYALGDKIQVGGTLKTYADFPIEGAKVSYKVGVYGPYRHFWDNNQAVKAEEKGETLTNEKGEYTIPVQLPEKIKGWMMMNVAVVITAPNGETVETSTTLPLSARTSYIQVSGWGERWCKETPKTISVEQVTATGENISAHGRYEFRKDGKVVTSGTFRTGEKFTPDLQHLPSGRYEVVTTTQVNESEVAQERRALTTDTTSVLVFSEKDELIPKAEVGELFTHSRLSDDGTSLHLLFASDKEVGTAFYDIIANGKVVHSERFPLSERLTRRTVTYDPTWGNGAMAVLSFINEGKLFTERFQLLRPTPNKALTWQWKTFRSSLRPGQDEEWTLALKRPDGSPVSASVMASLYDSSLDAFTPFNWSFNVHFDRSISYPSVATNIWSQILYTKYYGRYNGKKVDPLRFNAWRDDLGWDYGFGESFSIASKVYAGAIYGASTIPATAPRKALALTQEKAEVVSTASEQADMRVGASKKAEKPLEVRRNFAETAFFFPSLQTNAEGEAVLRFRLPESTTTWNFYGLAHDADVNFVKHTERIVARKEFTLTPALPRFLREGDRTEIPATIANLSQEKAKGQLRLILLDAQTLKEVHSETQRFEVEAGKGGNYSFFIDTPKADGVVVRLVAEGNNFSDGEEHVLPILSDRQEVVRTLPFTLRGRTSVTVPLEQLWPTGADHQRLVVEVTNNALWQVAAALPFVYKVNPKNACDWLGQYHASTLAHHLLQQNPALSALAKEDKETTAAWSERLRQNEDLRQLLIDETPWSPLANKEAERIAKLQTLFEESTYPTRSAEALKKLEALQNGDGGWSWYPGMRSNPWTTEAIVAALLRLRLFTGETQADERILAALNYLERDLQEDLKKKDFLLGNYHLEYLYLCALAKDMDLKPLPKSANLLLQYLKKELPKMNMECKAKAAVTLSVLNERQLADLALQSLLEHTVATNEMGRYFDSYRTKFSSSQYGISTQVATIEALQRLKPEDKALEELRLWLLQSKRGQHWQTTEMTMEAIYALLGKGKGAQPATLSATAEPLHVTARKDGKALPNPTTETATHPQQGLAGYGRANYDASATEVRVEKSDEGFAWGTVYAISSAPASTLSASASELSVERFFERQGKDGWVRVKAGETLGRGEEVRAVYNISASRDFDFVSLRAPRPAGLAPTNPLSGYRWTEVGAMYCVVHDASNDYFIEHLRKGHYRLSTTFRTDRAGRFTAAPARLQSVYAPEFVGFSGSATINVK